MNPKLHAFLAAQLASHKRTSRYTSELVAVVTGERPYAVEGCTCGFEITRPILARVHAQPGTRAYMEEREKLARVVEAQWTDHLIETVALGVAGWLEVPTSNGGQANDDEFMAATLIRGG